MIALTSGSTFNFLKGYRKRDVDAVVGEKKKKRARFKRPIQ